MNQITTIAGGGVPSVFQSAANLPDMNTAAQQGVSAGFAVIGYKGRNWRLKFGGDETLVADGQGRPIPVLEVVVVGVSPNISKIYYEKKYTEGDTESPDCWSVDGITPDISAPKKQCATCAACPKAAWGSRMTEAGKKAKACQDSRRIAVVPVGDIQNADYGGPMMLRVPPMSLGNFASYGKELARYGAQPYMVKTELGFDYNVAYPLLTFKALGWLSEDEAREVIEVMQDPAIERMLAAPEDHTPAAPEAPSALAQGGPPQTFQAPPQQPQPPAPPVAAAPPPPPPQPAPAAPAPAAASGQVVSGPFGKRKAAAQQPALAAPAPAVAPQPAAPTQEVPPTAATTTVVKAPEDLAGLIDNLLQS